MGIHIDHTIGSAVDLHARDVSADTRLAVWRLDVDRPAVVLGSRQRDDVLDLAACRAAGVEVAHRRSGGGAVHLVPGEVLWVDVLVPLGDPRSDADIRSSMVWMGERWAQALAAAGIGGSVDVHRGGMLGSSWSELICFAGIGPGEVLLDGRKLVGISQRRTRWGSRFQCAVHLRSDPSALLALLAAPRPVLSELPCVATLPGNGDQLDVLVDALVESIAGN